MNRLVLALVFLCSLVSVLCCRGSYPTSAPAQPPAPVLVAPTQPMVVCPQITLSPTWPLPSLAPLTFPPPTPTPTESSWMCAPGTLDESMPSAGKNRQFRLHIPPSYRSDQPIPLIINLHGTGAYGEGQEQYTGMSSLADRESFIVVYPQGLGETPAWDLEPGEQNIDIAFIRDLISLLENRCAIDLTRIYATGMSNGGGMTNRLGCELSDRIAAIAPVVGAYAYFGVCPISRPVPVIAFHGDADESVPYEGTGSPELLNVVSGVFPPIYYWAATWALRDGCASRPAVISQKQGVLGEAWQGCKDGAEVILYTLAGAGHIWPGSRILPGEPSVINASELIWAFFEKHAISP